MTELTMDQELQLIKLEIENLKFLYWSYSKGEARDHYIAVAHAESRRMLDEFYEKWKVKKP